MSSNVRLAVFGRVFALVAVLGMLGCGSTDAPATVNNEENNAMENNPTGTVPQNSVLQHVAPDCDPSQPNCQLDLTFSSGRLIKVKLIDPDGLPVDGVAVNFDIDAGDAQGTILGSANATTTSEGVAETEVKAAATQGVATVTVSVGSDPNVEPVKFLIAVSPKGSASYEIQLTQQGSQELGNIKALLYKSDVTCEAVYEDIAKERDDDPATFPSLQGEFNLTGSTDAAGNLPTLLQPGVMNETAYTVAVYAYARNNAEVEMAFGCKDMNPPVRNGQTVTVEVTLRDHFPNLVGQYEITHTFDLADGLPPNIKAVVDIIGRVITDPGSFLVGCDSNDPDCSSDQGLAHLLLDLDFLPQGVRDTLNDVLNSDTFKGIIRNVVNDFLGDFIDNASFIPDWVKDGIDITQDIYSTLREMRVVGLIRITEPPTVVPDENNNLTAVIGADTGEQVWQDIIVYWRRGCGPMDPPTCGERHLLQALPQEDATIEGTFDGSVQVTSDGYMFTINQHALSLNYGVLILGIIEKVVLPAAFGADVDSIVKLINRLVTGDAGGDACDPLAMAVGGSFENLARNFCQNAIQTASERLRDYVASRLVLDGTDSFLIGTPVDKPCALRAADPASYMGDWEGKPLPYIEGVGEEDPECDWDVNIKFSEGNMVNMPGTFHGSKKQ